MARHWWIRTLGGNGRRRRMHAAPVVSAVVALGLAAGTLIGSCGGPSGRSSDTAGPRSTSSGPPATTPTTEAPTAAQGLAAYFAAAEADDRALRSAATAVNAGIGAETLTLTQAARTAIGAADPSAAAAAVPAGLPATLAQQVLLVQSDLVSRFWALRGFLIPFTGTTGTASLPRSNPDTAYGLQCLGNGSDAAAHFAGDLAAARAAAARVAPVTPAAPDSTAAADLALWLQDMALRNAGCGGCGGQRVTSLPTITWHQIGPQFPGDRSWDGDIGGIPFGATYAAGTGWTVTLAAC